jgi:putative transposase
MLFVRKFDPLIHHRRSIRLRGYDYSRPGRYFITICCQGRECRFGTIENGIMTLNDAGRMIEKWHQELPNKFPEISLGEYIVMPNHFHAIIIIMDPPNVRADLCVRPDDMGDTVQNRGEHVGSPLPDGSFQPDGAPLPRIVQWFKTMTTNEYIRGVKTLGWERFDGKLWQRNYYEHIIRDEKSFITISEYIKNNPAKWIDDKFYHP